jgi:hypothetical protein
MEHHAYFIIDEFFIAFFNSLAQIPTPASKRRKNAKNPLEKYPIAEIDRHEKITF